MVEDVRPFQASILVDERGVERAIFKLRKLWGTAIGSDFRRHQFFIPPGELERIKRKACIRRLKKMEKRIEQAISARNGGRRKWRPRTGTGPPGYFPDSEHKHGQS